MTKLIVELYASYTTANWRLKNDVAPLKEVTPKDAKLSFGRML
jgi:hypothetical protein